MKYDVRKVQGIILKNVCQLLFMWNVNWKADWNTIQRGIYAFLYLKVVRYEVSKKLKIVL